ncbi:MAG: hypothetical protein K6C12_00325, partial [Oscillospiraceae bacterium]|nr:hypothetical protein [Oscillospiraceae bacterium]
FEQKSAPAQPDRLYGSHFSLKLQGIAGIGPHKHEKCRICLVDKFGIFHVCVAPNGVQIRVLLPKGV